MSVNVYDVDDLENRSVPVEVVLNTTAYFNKYLKLNDSPIVRHLLKAIDGAGYYDEFHFQGTKEPMGIASKINLSNGLKAALCVALEPSKCFYLRSCGVNAICEILSLPTGNCIYEGMNYSETYGDKCDLIYKEKHFTSIKEFLFWRAENDCN